MFLSLHTNCWELNSYCLGYFKETSKSDVAANNLSMAKKVAALWLGWYGQALFPNFSLKNCYILHS